VASIGTCQVQAQKLDSPLAGCVCVIGVAVPTVGTGAGKGFISGRQETRESGTRESGGAIGAVDEGLGVRGEPTPIVGAGAGRGCV
jgi:hypothetical protein